MNILYNASSQPHLSIYSSSSSMPLLQSHNYSISHKFISCLHLQQQNALKRLRGGRDGRREEAVNRLSFYVAFSSMMSRLDEVGREK